jgi:hypothetical protein
VWRLLRRRILDTSKEALLDDKKAIEEAQLIRLGLGGVRSQLIAILDDLKRFASLHRQVHAPTYNKMIEALLEEEYH